MRSFWENSPSRSVVHQQPATIRTAGNGQFRPIVTLRTWVSMREWGVCDLVIVWRVACVYVGIPKCWGMTPVPCRRDGVRLPGRVFSSR